MTIDIIYIYTHWLYWISSYAINLIESPAQAAPPRATAWSVGGSPDGGSPPADAAMEWRDSGEIWGFPSMGVAPKMMVFVGENPTVKWMIWGTPHFRKPPISI